MTTPISDREVGGLDAPPLPPHHQTAQASVHRTDSDVSLASSTASVSATPPVPRSSSFTRSKRFLTGDGLSAREQVGILDHQEPSGVVSEEGDSAQHLARTFDIARSAMYEIFRGSSSALAPPPPPPHVQLSDHENKRRATVPPPPAPPMMSRRMSDVVWQDDIDESDDDHHPDHNHGNHDDKENAISVASSTGPQSPGSLASLSPKGIVNTAAIPNKLITTIPTSDKAIRTPVSAAPVNRNRRPVQNALTPNAAENTDRDLDAFEPSASSPYISPGPKSKTIARIRGFFSPRASPAAASADVKPTVPPMDLTDGEATEGTGEPKDASGLKPPVVKVAGPVPNSGIASSDVHGSQTGDYTSVAKKKHSLQSDQPVPSQIERPKRSTQSMALSNIGALPKPGPVQMTSRRERVHPNAFHIAAPAATQPNPNAFHIAAPAAAPAKPNPNSNALHVSAPASVSERVQNISAAESAAAIKKESVKKRTDLFRRFKMIQERARFDVGASDSKASPQVSATESLKEPQPIQPVPESPGERPVSTNASSEPAINETAAPSSTDDNMSFLSAAEEFSPEKTSKANQGEPSSPQDAISNEADVSPGKTSLSSPTVESVTTSSSGRSNGDRSCPHPGALDPSREVRMSHPLSHFGMPVARSAANNGVSAHGFMDGPVFEAVVEDGGKLRHTRRDSHAAYVNTLESAAEGESTPSLTEPVNESPVPGVDISPHEGAAPTEAPIKKTRSGLQKRLAMAKDAGAGMVARAKSIPRGASFPRLRSRGDSSERKSFVGAKTRPSREIAEGFAEKETSVTSVKTPEETDAKAKPSESETVQAKRESETEGAEPGSDNSPASKAIAPAQVNLANTTAKNDDSDATPLTAGDLQPTEKPLNTIELKIEPVPKGVGEKKPDEQPVGVSPPAAISKSFVNDASASKNEVSSAATPTAESAEKVLSLTETVDSRDANSQATATTTLPPSGTMDVGSIGTARKAAIAAAAAKLQPKTANALANRSAQGPPQMVKAVREKAVENIKNTNRVATRNTEKLVGAVPTKDQCAKVPEEIIEAPTKIATKEAWAPLAKNIPDQLPTKTSQVPTTPTSNGDRSTELGGKAMDVPTKNAELFENEAFKAEANAASVVAPNEAAKAVTKDTAEVAGSGPGDVCTEAGKIESTGKKTASGSRTIATGKAKGNVKVGRSRDEPEYVTIQRVIRRVRRDGSEEVVCKKIRLKPEKVLPNGDVVVRRTMKRMKDDGSGHEVLTVMQVIPRRKKTGDADEKEAQAADALSNEASSMPDLKVGSKKDLMRVKRDAKEEVDVVIDNRGARMSERSTSLPSGSLEGRRRRNGNKDGGRVGGNEDDGDTGSARLPRAKTVGNLRGGIGNRFEDVRTSKPGGRRLEGPFRRTRSGKVGRSKSGVSSRDGKEGRQSGSEGRRGLWGLVPRVISFHGRERREDGRRESGRSARSGGGGGFWRRV